MKATSSRGLRAGALAAGITGAFALLIAGGAPAEEGTNRGVTPTVTMEMDGNKPVFDGPSSVVRGTLLRVSNETDPQQIGPHFFTIARKKRIPDSREEFNRCFQGEIRMCNRIFKEHEVDFANEVVGKQLVDSGKEGWSTAFSNRQNGDSWFTETLDEDVTQTVSGRAGKTFHYFCMFHPSMRGKLNVEPRTPVE